MLYFHGFGLNTRNVRCKNYTITMTTDES